MALRQPRKLNIVSLSLMLALVAGGLYAAYFVPHWMAVRSVVHTMHRTCNEMYQEKNHERLMERLMAGAKEAGVLANSETFTVERVPYPPEELSAMEGPMRDQAVTRGKRCLITFDYTADAKIPLLGKKRPIRFHRAVDKTLETVRY